MSKIECRVSTCQHYCDDQCTLTGIRVDGPAAKESSQTCCDSFEEKRQEGGQNSSTSRKRPAMSSDIGCAAENCAYNKSCKCVADTIHVGNCSTQASSKSGTECCTFVSK